MGASFHHPLLPPDSLPRRAEAAQRFSLHRSKNPAAPRKNAENTGTRSGFQNSSPQRIGSNSAVASAFSPMASPAKAPAVSFT